MAMGLERFVFSDSIDNEEVILSPQNADTGCTLEEEVVEDRLSAKLMNGFMLLDQPCPKCTIPLVKQPATPTLLEKCCEADENDPTTPRIVTQLSMADMPKPVRGIPYCVACEQYVVTNEQETQLLDLLKTYDNQSIAETYDSIDTRGLMNLNASVNAGEAEGKATPSSSRHQQMGSVSNRESKDDTETNVSQGFLFQKSWSKWKRHDSSSVSVKSDVLGNKLSKQLLGMVASRDGQGVEMKLEAREDDSSAAFWKDVENSTAEKDPPQPPLTPRFILSRPSVQNEFGITEGGGGDILNEDEVEETLTALGVLSKEEDGFGDIEIREDSVGEIEVQESPRKQSKGYRYEDQERQLWSIQKEEAIWSKSLLKLAKKGTEETASTNTFEDCHEDKSKDASTQPEEDSTQNEDDCPQLQEKWEVEMLMNLASKSDTGDKSQTGEVSAALDKIEETALAVQNNQCSEEVVKNEKTANKTMQMQKEAAPSPEEYNDFDYSSWIKESLSHAASSKNDAPVSSNKSNNAGDDDVMQEYTARREIATRILGAKMLQGYALKESQCDRCGMPQMEYQSILHCVVCPVLAKKAKKELSRKEGVHTDKDTETDIVEQYIKEKEQSRKSKKKTDRKQNKYELTKDKSDATESLDEKKAKEKGERKNDRKAQETAQYVMQKQREAREAKAEEARVKKRYEEAKEVKRLRKAEERNKDSKINKKKNEKDSLLSDASNDTESVFVASSAPDNIKTADARRKDLVAKEKKLLEAVRTAREAEQNLDVGDEELSNDEKQKRKEEAARAAKIRNDQLRLIKEAKRLETMERMRLANEIEFQSSQESTLAVHALQGERKRLRKEATRQKEIRALEIARQEAELEARRIADEKRAAQEAEMIEALEAEAQLKAKEAEEAIAKAKAALAEVSSAKKGIIAQTIAQGEADTVAETEALVRAEAEDYHEEQLVASDSFLWRERWETLRIEGKSVMTRRLIAGWTMLPELCAGIECQSSAILAKGNKRECVVCGGTGTGKDGAYVAPTNDEEDELVETRKNKHHSAMPVDQATISSNNAVADEYSVRKVGLPASSKESYYAIEKHDNDKSTPHKTTEPTNQTSLQAQKDEKEWSAPSSTVEAVQKIHEDFEEKRAIVSKEIGKRMLQGWTLLDMSCPHCVMPLLTDEEGENEICVLCGVIGKLDTEEAPVESEDYVRRANDHEECKRNYNVDKSRQLKLDAGGESKEQNTTKQCPQMTENFVNMALKSAAGFWMNNSNPMLESQGRQTKEHTNTISKASTNGIFGIMSCTPKTAVSMVEGACHQETLALPSGTGLGLLGGQNTQKRAPSKATSAVDSSPEQTSDYGEETSSYTYDISHSGNNKDSHASDGTGTSSSLIKEQYVGAKSYNNAKNVPSQDSLEWQRRSELGQEQELYFSSGDCPTDEITTSSMVPIASFAVEPEKSETETAAPSSREQWKKKATEVALEKVNARRGMREKELRTKTITTNSKDRNDHAMSEPLAPSSSFNSCSSRANKKGLTIDTSEVNNKEPPVLETGSTPRTPPKTLERRGSGGGSPFESPSRQSPLASPRRVKRASMSPMGPNYDELAARLRSLLADSRTPTGTSTFREANSAPNSPRRTSHEIPDYLISTIAGKQTKDSSSGKHADPPAMTSTAFFGRRVAKDPEDRRQQGQTSPLHSPRTFASPRGRNSPMHSPHAMASPQGMPKARPPFPARSPRAAMSPSAAGSPRPFLFPESPGSRIRRSFDENEGVTLVIPNDFDVTDNQQLRELIMAAKLDNSSVQAAGKTKQKSEATEIIDLIDMECPQRNEEMAGHVSTVSTMTSKDFSGTSRRQLKIETAQMERSSGTLPKQPVHVPSPGESEAIRPSSFKSSSHLSKKNIVVGAMHPPSPGEDEASGRPFAESPQHTVKRVRPSPESMMNRPRTRGTPRRNSGSQSTPEFIGQSPGKRSTSAQVNKCDMRSTPRENTESQPQNETIGQKKFVQVYDGGRTGDRSNNFTSKGSVANANEDMITPEQLYSSSDSAARRQSTVEQDNIISTNLSSTGSHHSGADAITTQSSLTMTMAVHESGLPPKSPRHGSSGERRSFCERSTNNSASGSWTPNSGDRKRVRDDNDSVASGSSTTNVCDRQSVGESTLATAREDTGVYKVTASVAPAHGKSNEYDDTEREATSVSSKKGIQNTAGKRSREGAETKVLVQTSSVVGFEIKRASSGVSSASGKTSLHSGLTSATTGASSATSRKFRESYTRKSKEVASDEEKSVHSTHFGDILSRIDSCKEKLEKSSSTDSRGNRRPSSLDLLGKFTAAAADMDTEVESSFDGDNSTANSTTS